MEKAPQIPITRPVFGRRELELIRRTLDSGWVVQGPMVQRLEEMFAKVTGSAQAIAVCNCTCGLHLVLHALGIGPGDEVVVPSFTYIASANAVEYTGAKPVFCDIDLDTYTLDLESLESRITPACKAVMPVSLFGLGLDYKGLDVVAKRHGLIIIEDAACALGSMVDDYHSGSRCKAAVFSLHPRKAITTGEGGMIITGDPDFASMLGRMRNHGAESTDLERHYSRGGSLLPEFNVLGFNYRLTDIQAALGVAQMERLPEILKERREAAQRYNELLYDSKLVRIPLEPLGYIHSYQSYVVLFTGGEEPDLDNLTRLNQRRNLLMQRLELAGISTRQGTHAVHTLGYYADKYGIKPEEFPKSLLADRLSMTLPLYAGITAADQHRVVEQLHSLGRD